mgnify:FL=1
MVIAANIHDFLIQMLRLRIFCKEMNQILSNYKEIKSNLAFVRKVWVFIRAQEVSRSDITVISTLIKCVLYLSQVVIGCLNLLSHIPST